MPDPDLHLETTDVPAGRSADFVNRCVMTLRDDAELVALVGGDDDGTDATNVVPATSQREPEPVLLVCESVVTASTQRGNVERATSTLEVAPFITPSAHSSADPDYLETVRDVAIQTLKDEGIGPGWSYLGQTNDIAFEQPRSSEDSNALVQYTGRIQFAHGAE